MRNLEDELREALEEDARQTPVPADLPQELTGRIRRRQIMNVTVGVVAVGAVMMASFVGLRSVLNTSVVRPGVGTAETRTSTVLGGVTVTYPADWFLLKLGGTFDRLQSHALFQLSNFDPLDQNRWVCPQPSGDIPQGGVVLYVQEPVGLPGQGPLRPAWPVEPGGPRHDLGLGCGVLEHYATWTAGGLVYEAFLGGEAGPPFDRILDAFRSMEFDRRFAPFEAQVGPEYVLDSGRVAGRRWNLTTDAHRPKGPQSPCLKMEVFDPREGSASAFCEIRLGGGAAIDLSEGPVVGVSGLLWGAVNSRATTVLARLETGSTVPGTIIPFPPSFGVEFQAFVFELPSGSQGEIVALDQAGGEMATVPFKACPQGFCN